MKNIGWPMRSWFIKAQSSSVVPLVPGGARMYCWRRLRRGDSKPDRPIRKDARSVESNTLSAAVMLPLNLSVNCRRGTRLGRLAYWRLCNAALKADCAGTVASSKSSLIKSLSAFSAASFSFASAFCGCATGVGVGAAVVAAFFASSFSACAFSIAAFFACSFSASALSKAA